MTTAPTTPQQLRDRLLQAVDAQSHILNMVAVLDVITNLEKYPITKEALEETRLGKLINDLRKRTRDEDLAKRAKKLLRNWQKLIVPHQNEKLPKDLSGTANGYHQNPPLPVNRSVQTVADKSVLHTSYSSNTDKLRLVNYKSEQKTDESLTKLKASKLSIYDQIPASGDVADPEALSGVALPMQSSTVKPLVSAPELKKQPSTVLRTSVLQQYGQRDRAATKKEQQKLPSQYSPPSPKTTKQLGATKRPMSLAGSESEQFSAIHSIHTEIQQPKEALTHHNDNDTLENNERTLEQLQKSRGFKRLHPGLLSEVTNVETEKDIKLSEGKRRKHQSRDYTAGLEGRSAEDTCKSARVKNRKLTFDPFTQQIRPSAVSQSEEQHSSALDLGEADNLKQSPSVSSPSALHKTNWKDLSQNEIVKYYLNLQNNLLKTSGSQNPSAHSFMTECLKREEDHITDSDKVCLLMPSMSETDLPGRGRDITPEDINRIHNQHWPGVNGCYDSKGVWYGWTDCISLDPYGDGSKLNVLPYVCID